MSTWLERWKINRKAKQKLGLKMSSDEYTFMTACVANFVDEGSDPTEAQMICALLYEEGDISDFE